MTFLPVVERELRAQAHSPVTWRLRLLAAGLATFGFASLAFSSPDSFARSGRSAFYLLNGFAALGIVVICPVLTADCLSREKREGTLGLLFLTPLTARDIVVGKAMAQALRALLLWLGAAPVLLLPLLLGGVGVESVVVTLAIQAACLALGLSSGLLASACSRQAASALAAAYAIFLCTVFVAGLVMVWLGAAASSILHINAPVVVAPCVLMVGTALTTWLHVQSAADTLRTDWNVTDAPPEISPPPITATADSGPAVSEAAAAVRPDRFSRWIDRQRRELLERSPLEWLFIRGGSSFSVEHNALFWMTIIAYPGSVTLFFQGDPAWTAVPLLVAMTLTAGASLRAERRNGTLETLLVLPVPPSAVLRGQAGRIFRIFFPAVVVSAVLTLWARAWQVGEIALPPVVVTAFLALVSLPAFGAWAVLRTRHSVVGLLVVLAGAWVIPWQAARWIFQSFFFWLPAVAAFFRLEQPWNAGSIVFLLMHAVLAVFAWKGACGMLRDREFLSQP